MNNRTLVRFAGMFVKKGPATFLSLEDVTDIDTIIFGIEFGAGIDCILMGGQSTVRGGNHGGSKDDN